VRRPLVRLSGLAVPLGAAVVALLLSSAGPAAAGTGYGQLIANPGTVAPGQSISLLGTCPNNGKGLAGVYSSAFAGGSASVTTTQINFSGTAMIASNASGQYTVTADCGGGNPSVTITVTGAGSVTTSHPAATSQAAAPPSAVHTTAVAPPVVATSSAAIVGGTVPAKSATPVPSSPGAQAMGGITPVSNGPVTSTGIVRVGLAGDTHSALTMTGAAAIAVAIALAGGLGFLVIRRRRNSSSPGSHF
jgi:hypothetical protein